VYSLAKSRDWRFGIGDSKKAGFLESQISAFFTNFSFFELVIGGLGLEAWEEHAFFKAPIPNHGSYQLPVFLNSSTPC
jgi:hypothetical protein